MKKGLRICILMIVLYVCMSSTIHAEEVIDTEGIIESQLNLLDWDTIKEVEEQIKQVAPYTQDFNLMEEVVSLASGEKEISLNYVINSVATLFLSEIWSHVRILIRFILIVILCSLLQTLSSSFKSKDATKIAFIVCYMMILLLISQSLYVIVDLARGIVDQLSQVMLATLPTLLAFIAVSGYITSSSAMATIIISGLNIMTFIVNTFILPIVSSLIVLQIVSSMSEEVKIDQFVGLFYKAVKIAMKFIFFTSIGIMGMYRMTLPLLDVPIKKSILSLSTSFIPIVGSASQGAIEFVLFAGQLIKNAFVSGVLVWICVLASIPLIKILTYVALYNLAGAVIQPIADKKMVKITTILAKGCEFILSCVGTVVLLTIAVLIVCASIGTSIA